MGNERMTMLRPDVEEFLQQLERYSKRKFYHPVEAGELLQIVMQTGLTEEFEELIFQAKFLVRTQEVMTRIGPGSHGFDKFSLEFQTSLQKSLDMMKTMIGRAPSDVMNKYETLFFGMEPKCMDHLMKLLSDLSWIKNWQVDNNKLPFDKGYSISVSSTQERPVPAGDFNRKNHLIMLIRIQKIVLLVLPLFILFLFLDPPVTLLGRILSLGISVLLAYIIFQLYFLNRPSNSLRE